MLLSKLIQDAPDIKITNIMTDSRKKRKNSIYFALKGFRNDGHNFIDQAIENGAIVVIHSEEILNKNEEVIYYKVEDVYEMLTQILIRYYNDPSNNMTLFGVTGTNGKTSVTSIIKNLLDNYQPTGYIGTLGVEYQDKKLEPSLTTPLINDLYEILASMNKAKVKACTLEVSSISLEQKRVNGLDFDFAIFTNLTHDHLDYHNTLDSYFESKKLLFDNLSSDAYAIVNIDDPKGLEIVQDTKAKVITYGIDNNADFIARDIKLLKNSTSFTLEYDGHSYRINTNLIAKFNIYNLLASLSALITFGVDIEELMPQLSNIKAIDGRMEVIDVGQPFNVIVDFAHTPDGILKVMNYAKSITPTTNRIIGVFGSAGKRDTKKRKVFGELANQYCNLTILTEDDPRDEQVHDIAMQIAEGITNNKYIIIESREDAIRQAIEIANTHDTIIILGKGNEKFMYYEEGKVDYQGDDIIAKYMIENYGIKGENENEIQ